MFSHTSPGIEPMAQRDVRVLPLHHPTTQLILWKLFTMLRLSWYPNAWYFPRKSWNFNLGKCPEFTELLQYYTYLQMNFLWNVCENDFVNHVNIFYLTQQQRSLRFCRKVVILRNSSHERLFTGDNTYTVMCELIFTVVLLQVLLSIDVLLYFDIPNEYS